MSNRRPLTEMFKIIASPPPPTPLGYPQGMPIAVNLEDEAKKESDPAKLISDDSSSDAEDIDIENLSRNQIWNTLNANVQFIWCDYFLI